ncbi:MAG: glycerol-3-phosphate acyltransferase [Anaerolineales bacterium]
MALRVILALVGGYLLGCVPTGYLLVRWRTGGDVRQENSGRVGGTNVMRSAGFAAGLLTAIGDMAKAWVAVGLAQWLLPAVPLVHVGAGLLSIVGHNYNVLLARREDGRLVFGGGAGGAATVGAAIGLWAPAGLIIIPMAALVLLLRGYASVATMSVGLAAIAIFGWRGWAGMGPAAYVLFGVGAEILLLWSLRPNIRRLLAGQERVVGPRARRLEKRLRARQGMSDESSQQSGSQREESAAH